MMLIRVKQNHMHPRTFLETSALAGSALALGSRLGARPENLLFQQLRELNQRLPLQKTHGVYHPAITHISLCEEDYADLARNTQTPQLDFKTVPDLNGVLQPRHALYRWIVISLTKERRITDCIHYESLGQLYTSAHYFFPPAITGENSLRLRRESIEWENVSATEAPIDAHTAPPFTDNDAWKHVEGQAQRNLKQESRVR